MKPFSPSPVLRATLGALAVSLALASVAAAQAPGGDSLGAGWRQQQDEARQGVDQRRLKPLSEVIAQLGRTTPGRQLDAGLEDQNGRQVYRVRWMTADGRRVDYMIDAVTGLILSGR
ncbi:MAG TPA: PepSY domain-containing protein [Caulobacteraceae bacterium]|jgi:uncharacterized membrane protein YkoI